MTGGVGGGGGGEGGGGEGGGEEGGQRLKLRSIISAQANRVLPFRLVLGQYGSTWAISKSILDLVKEQCHEVFELQFFHHSLPTDPLIYN